MTPWVRDGDLYRCPRHGGEPFDPAKQPCSSCGADPGAPIDLEVDAPLSKPPTGCNSSVQHERELTSLAKFALERSKKLGTSGLSSKTQNAAVKWADIAVKARRAAAAQSTRREDEEIVRRREKRQRARDRGVAN